jgi:hypothetical protein
VCVRPSERAQRAHVFTKPRLGRRRRSGVWPPSNAKWGLLPVEDAQNARERELRLRKLGQAWYAANTRAQNPRVSGAAAWARARKSRAWAPRTAARFLALVAARGRLAHARADASPHALALLASGRQQAAHVSGGVRVCTPTASDSARAARACLRAPGLSCSVLSANRPAADTGAPGGSSCCAPAAQRGRLCARPAKPRAAAAPAAAQAVSAAATRRCAPHIAPSTVAPGGDF